MADDDTVRLDAADVRWTAATGSARWAIVDGRVFRFVGDEMREAQPIDVHVKGRMIPVWGNLDEPTEALAQRAGVDPAQVVSVVLIDHAPDGRFEPRTETLADPSDSADVRE